MKTIGLIGGMSWESSKMYYEFLNRYTKERLGGSHSSKIIMISVDFAEVEKLTFNNDWEGIGVLVADAARKLEQAGADILLLCTNTIHKVAAHIMEAVTIPFLHIAETTGAAIRSRGLKKVALLGTQFTMEETFYRHYLLDEFGIEALIPPLEERKRLQSIIYNELVKGQFHEDSKQACLEMIQGLEAQGTEGVIMGCTELPLLIPESELELPSFDTSKLHAEAAVDWALK